MAQTFDERHEEAIETRQRALAIYQRVLGDHPFTATILNYIGNNYYALREYPQAIAHISQALEIRQIFLGNHLDTAKSLFDLGIVYKFLSLQ